MNTKTKRVYTGFNKYAYAVCVITGIIFLSMKDYSQGAICITLALVFDPFNQATPFGKRPFWQRAWLVVHLLAGIGLFCLMFAMGK